MVYQNLFNIFFLNIKGLWPSDTCPLKKPGVESGVFQRIFNLTCPALGDLPDKKLYLRGFNDNFMIGSIATYECFAGYQFPDRVSIIKLSSERYDK